MKTDYARPTIQVCESLTEGVYLASGAVAATGGGNCWHGVVESENATSGRHAFTLAFTHDDMEHQEQEWFTAEVVLSQELPPTVTVGGEISGKPGFAVAGSHIYFEGYHNGSNPGSPSWHLLELNGEGAEDISVVAINARCKGI